MTPAHRALKATNDKSVHIADGFSYKTTLSQGGFEWQEQRLVVRSFKHAAAKQSALDKRLEKAKQEIDALNLRGGGRKNLNEEDARAAVYAIVKRHEVSELPSVGYQVVSKTTLKRGYLGRPAQNVTKVTVTISTTLNVTTYDETVRCLGWRVFICNDSEISLNEAVLAYRNEYLIERGFNRLRGKLLGMTPLYLSSTTRIKDLIRLLCIGLRVLCLVEFTVREALRKNSEKLAGIYTGNPKRAITRPTTEMMHKAFVGINLIVVNLGEAKCRSIKPINTVQLKIFNLLDFPETTYQRLAQHSGKLVLKMSEP